MDRDSKLPQAVLMSVVVVPLALLVGYLLTNPFSKLTILGVGLLVGLILLPLVLRWHHAALVCLWNAAVVVFFLPGQPPLWAALAGVSLGVAVVTRTLRAKSTFVWVPSLAYPLLLLALIVVTTIAIRGIGGRAFGSEMWGAKRYMGVLGAIVGYFALTGATIPRERAEMYSGLFFLSAVTSIMSDLAFALGPSFYFLFMFFPTDVASAQFTTQDTLRRLAGVTWMAQATYWFMLLRYGIRGLVDLRHPWRPAVFVAMILLSLLGGFRSSLILLGLLFLVQFWFEGLLRTKLFPIVVLGGLLIGSVIVGYAERLPLSVQRTLSFLPIQVHPSARQDAQGSLDWRLQMWRVVLGDVPQYLWLGKGYTFSGTDFMLMQESIRRGMFDSYEDTLVSGNYHNGLLTLIIPFGLPGTVAFAAFVFAGWRVLRSNYLYGPKELKRINTFLIAYFTTRLVFYLGLYGQFDLDLMVFTGVVGLSVSLNGGVCRPPGPGQQPALAPAHA